GRGEDGFERERAPMFVGCDEAGGMADRLRDAELEVADMGAQHGVEQAEEADVDRDAAAVDELAVVAVVTPAQDSVGEVAGRCRATGEADDIDVELQRRAGTDGGAGVEVVVEPVADVSVEALQLQVHPGLQLESERTADDDVVAHSAGR